MWSFKSILILAGLPVISFAVTRIYYHLEKEKEWREFLKYIRRYKAEFKIPTRKVGRLIGLAGIQLREIENSTKTQIQIQNIDGETNFLICQIFGEKGNVENAKKCVLEITYPKDIEEIEIWVPQVACAHMVGRNGNNIKRIAYATNTYIELDNKQTSWNMKPIVINGNSENVVEAKELVEKELNGFLKKMRTKTLHSIYSKCTKVPVPPNMNLEIIKLPQYGWLNVSDILIEVFISFVRSPSQFWLQVISKKDHDLDRLTDAMTDYYSLEINKLCHQLKEVKIGQIVACQFHDKKWYRAEVISIAVNELEDVEESKIVVFYVDYGDIASYRLCDLLKLTPNFLNLNFQAIEVSMALLESRVGGDAWEKAAIDAFTERVYSPQRKAMLAEVVCYKQRNEGIDEPLVPCIKLFDPADKVIDIGNYLIDKGFAVALTSEKGAVLGGLEEHWDS